MAKLSKEELQWQAESDARTLAQYEEIMQDSSRKRAAVNQAKKEAAKLQKRVSVMQKAANTSSSRKKQK